MEAREREIQRKRRVRVVADFGNCLSETSLTGWRSRRMLYWEGWIGTPERDARKGERGFDSWGVGL